MFRVTYENADYRGLDGGLWGAVHFVKELRGTILVQARIGLQGVQTY